jgi:hypothetical protein
LRSLDLGLELEVFFPKGGNLNMDILRSMFLALQLVLILLYLVPKLLNMLLFPCLFFDFHQLTPQLDYLAF